MATPGIYLLTIRLSRLCKHTAANRHFLLKPGWYVYCGSARAGLEGRLARHLRTDRVKHWHVDTLLAQGKVADIQVVVTDDPAAECRLAQALEQWPGATPVPGFGCSDCTCLSHLCHFAQRPGVSIFADDVLPHLDAAFTEMRTVYRDYTETPGDPFRTLITCILSLRTQDPVTHAAAERLFSRLPTPAALRDASAATIEKLIYPVGMYRQKAETLIAISRQILNELDGRVPSDIDALVNLPGVGRKTANLVRSFAFNLPAVCVDTHVHRITNRWGLIRTATPEQSEEELRRLLPERHWMPLNPFLVQHGQQVCRPTQPICSRCRFTSWCQYPRVLAGMELIAALPGAPLHPTLKALSPA